MAGSRLPLPVSNKMSARATSTAHKGMSQYFLLRTICDNTPRRKAHMFSGGFGCDVISAGFPIPLRAMAKLVRL